MSGPVTTPDDDPVTAVDDPVTAGVELVEGKPAMVGSLPVRRALPRRGRRTVGPWCFADLMGPVDDARAGGIGPHPHIGLQTVTWLLDGELLHLDSLGSEQPIRPGQLNLMTAGHGVAHAEESPGGGGLHGIQLWIAQPEATRHGAPGFEHHAELPQLELGSGTATVLVGTLGGMTSPARADTSHVGAEVVLAGRVVVPLDGAFEHALLVTTGAVDVAGAVVPAGTLAYLPPGRDEIRVNAAVPSRLLLLGGEPFDEELVMWWNYVGRTRAEITDAHAAWTARTERFGEVASSLAAIDVDAPPWRRGA
ncbi:MAG: pirin family protein [Acidimicrobiales bacterium]